MTQNRSNAVMASRVEPDDSLDDFPTPMWATRALCEHVIDVRGTSVWEPACGRGHMARALREYALHVYATDVHDYGHGGVKDFLWPGAPTEYDLIITNPPFRLAYQFVDRGLDIAQRGVAVLVRSVFIESIARYQNLFRDRPPAIMGQFTERVPMVKGRVDPEASTATSYCWLVWYREPAWNGTKLVWIPPCRRKLERPGDYGAVTSGATLDKTTIDGGKAEP